MSDDDIPHAIAESTIQICGHVLHVYVLNDGSRVIDKNDADALFESWANGVTMTGEEAAALAKVLRGSP